jgi:Domain of unknown function (DUF932)
MNNFHDRSLANVLTSSNSPMTIDAIRQYAPSVFAVSPHESRSARYTYIPTSAVLDGLLSEGFQPMRAIQSRSRIEGKAEFTKHMLRLRHQDAVANSLGLFPEVIIVNSHDGTSAYKIFAGIFRKICSNGLVAGEKWGEISVQHKGNVVHNVIEGSFQIVSNAKKAMEVSEQWSNLQLTAGEQQAFAAAAHTLRFENADGIVTTPITPAQLLTPRRTEDTASGPFDRWNQSRNQAAPDLWRTLNVTQENVIAGGLHNVSRTMDENGRVSRRNVTTRAVVGIDQDTKLNRALWMLAEKMAELKGASA